MKNYIVNTTATVLEYLIVLELSEKPSESG